MKQTIDQWLDHGVQIERQIASGNANIPAVYNDFDAMHSLTRDVEAGDPATAEDMHHEEWGLFLRFAPLMREK